MKQEERAREALEPVAVGAAAAHRPGQPHLTVRRREERPQREQQMIGHRGPVRAGPAGVRREGAILGREREMRGIEGGHPLRVYAFPSSTAALEDGLE